MTQKKNKTPAGRWGADSIPPLITLNHRARDFLKFLQPKQKFMSTCL